MESGVVCVVWSDVVSCGAVWCSVVQCGAVCYGVVWFAVD